MKGRSGIHSMRYTPEFQEIRKIIVIWANSLKLSKLAALSGQHFVLLAYKDFTECPSFY